LFHFILRAAASCRQLLSVGLLCFALCLSLSCKHKPDENRFRELIESADRYKKEGKFDEARIELLSAINVKPKSADAYAKLAEILARQQQLRAALENYNTAINYDPNHRDARLQLAAILLAGHQWEPAEVHIQKLLTMNPADNEARILEATLLAAGPHKDVAKAQSI